MKFAILAALAALSFTATAFAQPPAPMGVPAPQGPMGVPVHPGGPPIRGIIIHRCGGSIGEGCGPGQYCAMSPGVCARPGATGVCRPRPHICPEIFAPVCGCDGRTYPNACVAASNGASVAHNGRCRPTRPPGIWYPPGSHGGVTPVHPPGVVVTPQGPGRPGFPNGIPVDPQIQRQQQR